MFVLVFITAAVVDRHPGAPGISPGLAHSAVLGLGAALLGHALPGFEDLVAMDARRFTEDAAPYHLSLGLDRPLVGLMLLAFGHPLLTRPVEWARIGRAAIPVVATVAMVPPRSSLPPRELR